MANQADQSGADRMSARIWNFLSSEIAPYVRAKDKKPLTRQIREMRAMYREYGTLPYYYVMSQLRGKCREAFIKLRECSQGIAALRYRLPTSSAWAGSSSISAYGPKA